MRLETKIGAAITVLALGAVLAFVSRGGSKPIVPPTAVTQDEPIPPVVVAPSPDATASDNTGALASPPPIGLRDDAARSFRPKDIEPVVEPQPAATERTGLSGVAAVAPTPSPTPAITPAPVGNAAAPVPPAPAPTPAVANAQPAATPPTEPTKEHIIEIGDNFSLLAVKYYGNGKYANLIAKANPDKDPKRLKLGSKIKIPPAPVAAVASATPPVIATPAATTAQPLTAVTAPKKVAEPPPPVPADRAYKVQPGESWNDLGKKFLGDAQRWPELYELNKERVPRNPRNLRPGVTIEVPATKPS